MESSVRAWASGLLIATTLGSAGAKSGRSQSQTVIVAALEQYRVGSFDTAITTLLRGRTLTSRSREFKRDAEAWIKGAQTSERGRRLHVAAAMTVELMAASFDQSLFEYLTSRELVEWACERLRRGPPTDFERRFHLASIALMQGARDDALLSGMPHAILASYAIPGGGSHVRHAGIRFPGESRFKLAHVTTRWETQSLATWPLPPAYILDQSMGGFSIDKAGSAKQFDDTLKILAQLFLDPAVGTEARLRSGVLRFVLGSPREARSDFEAAASSSDTSVRHLAQLMLGTIADQAGNLDAALQHYQLAHTTLSASGSSIALSAALYRAGRSREATDVLEAFAAGPPPPDPWRLYGQRDYRFFDAYRATMRQAIWP